MYTRCPACLTQFRVRAAQLGAAGGRVRCGACGEAFDALSRLADTPQPPADTAPPDPVITPTPAATSAESGLAAAPLAADSAVDWTDDDERLRRPRHTGRWLALAVLLILMALAQAAWFKRDLLYDRFPQLLPWAEQLCQRLDCQVYRERQLSRFELLNRDVRVHPVYEDALLVNATIANQAGKRQPYPRIQLALFDNDGNALAYREFAPDTYLDASLPISEGMPPDTPIHIVLELSGASEGAVSFEFGFL